MDSVNVAQKRSILLSARIQFSPETQPIKETAIDKVVEQNLFVDGKMISFRCAKSRGTVFSVLQMEYRR